VKIYAGNTFKNQKMKKTKEKKRKKAKRDGFCRSGFFHGETGFLRGVTSFLRGVTGSLRGVTGFLRGVTDFPRDVTPLRDVFFFGAAALVDSPFVEVGECSPSDTSPSDCGSELVPAVRANTGRTKILIRCFNTCSVSRKTNSAWIF